MYKGLIFKLRKFALFFVLCICAIQEVGFCQAKLDTALVNTVDRLNIAVKNKEWASASKISLQLAALNSRQGRRDDAIQSNIDGIEYAKKAGDIELEFAHYRGLGYKYGRKYELGKQMEAYLKGLKLADKVRDRPNVVWIKQAIAEIYYQVGDNDKAMTYLVPAYEESQRLVPKITIINLTMGQVFEAQGKYKESLKYFEKYLEQVPATNKEALSGGYSNIAYNYIFLKEFDKATSYTIKADQLNDSVRSPTGKIRNLINFGSIARAKGEHKQAIQYINRAVAIAQANKQTGFESTCYVILYSCYQEIGNYQNAYIYLRRQTALVDTTFKRASITRAQVYEAAYRVEAETEKNQLQIASLQKENDLKKLQLTNLTDRERINKLGMINLNKEKSLTLFKLNNFRQNDSLNRLKLDNYQKANVLAGMQVQSLNQQNELKNLEISVQRRNLLLMVVGGAILLFVLFVYYRRYRFKKLLEVENIRSNIAADFHDELGSTLSSIALYSEMALRDDMADVQRTKGILSLIGESSRGTVSAMQDMIWTIQPKNDNMHEVINRMREYAFPLAEVKNISLKLNIEEEVKSIELPMDIRKNIYLIFKEALNNAFKYASAQSIVVSFAKQQNTLVLSVKDDGEGFVPALARQGNGLRNMYKRAEQAKGTLTVETKTGNGTEILFTCPIS